MAVASRRGAAAGAAALLLAGLARGRGPAPIQPPVAPSPPPPTPGVARAIAGIRAAHEQLGRIKAEYERQDGHGRIDPALRAREGDQARLVSTLIDDLIEQVPTSPADLQAMSRLMVDFGMAPDADDMAHWGIRLAWAVGTTMAVRPAHSGG